MTPQASRESALWRDCKADSLSVANQALVREAGRLLDRLDGLNELLEGRQDRWVEIMVGDQSVTLVVDKLLAEARQYALAYGVLSDKMRTAGITGKVQAAGTPTGGYADELKRKREEREAELRSAQ